MSETVNLYRVIFTFLIFGFLASTFIFIFLAQFYIFDVKLNPQVESIMQDFTNKGMIDPNSMAQITAVFNWYHNFDMKLDYLFLLMWVYMFTFACYIAVNVLPLPKFEFLSMLFIGIMLLLFVFHFFIDFVNWFIQEFIYSSFDASLTNLPWFNFYIENQYYIIFSEILIILLLNRIFGKDGFKEESISNPYNQQGLVVEQ
jgi:hypothetical protein